VEDPEGVLDDGEQVLPPVEGGEPLQNSDEDLDLVRRKRMGLTRWMRIALQVILDIMK